MFLAYKYKDNIFDPAYSYEEGEEFRKILRPYNKPYKWTSNVPRRYYQGYKQLDQTGDILIVTSSLKDVMIWRLFGYNAICPTGETVFLTQNALELLSYRFKKIILNYDNDNEGVQQSLKVMKEFKINYILTPDYKDISDYIYFQGYEKTKQLIKNLI
jgi:DNA primase